MLLDSWITDFDDEKAPSLVEKVFDDPENICQGEYTAIYEFLLCPSIRTDPSAIIGVLEEFVGWAQYMLEQMQKRDEYSNAPQDH